MVVMNAYCCQIIKLPLITLRQIVFFFPKQQSVVNINLYINEMLAVRPLFWDGTSWKLCRFAETGARRHLINDGAAKVSFMTWWVLFLAELIWRYLLVGELGGVHFVLELPDHGRDDHGSFRRQRLHVAKQAAQSRQHRLWYQLLTDDWHLS